MSDKTIQLKRQLTVKTLVNSTFRERAKHDLGEEIKLLDTQLQQLDAQYQQTLKQLEEAAKQGQNVQQQLAQLNNDAQQRRNQIAGVKVQVSSQVANLDRVPDGEYIVTGVLEYLVTVGIGDNIYEKLGNAEMVIEDGIVKSISD